MRPAAVAHHRDFATALANRIMLGAHYPELEPRIHFIRHRCPSLSELECGVKRTHPPRSAQGIPSHAPDRACVRTLGANLGLDTYSHLWQTPLCHMSAPQQPTGSTLTREQILAALRALSAELGDRGLMGELCVFGGTVMMLAFTARLATKDVDGLFQPAQMIRELAHRIAEVQQLPANWLNDGVKGFISARHETTTGNLPQFPHLRLTMPVPEYLLAMKCMAARIGGTTDETSDVADITYLIRHLAMNSAKEVLDLVSHYYPANRVPVKTQYLVEGLFEEGKV